MFPRRSDRRLRRRPLGRYRYVRLRWRLLFAVVDWLGSLAFGVARRLRSLLVRVCSGRPPLSAKDRPRNNLPLPSRERVGVRGSCLTADPTPPDAARTILVIQLDHLGDAIISTVMFPPLRKRYPNASIEVLASPWNRELFEAIPEVDHVHLCRVNRFARRGRLGWIWSTVYWGFRLRGRKVDVGIDVRGEFPHAVILWLSGARRRVGWAAGGGGFLLTDSPRLELDRPEVESRLALLAELGIRPDGRAGTPRPVFRPPQQARRRAARRLAEWSWGRASHGLRIAVHVGAGTPAKSWPAEHWRALVGRLVERFGAEVLLVGSASDGTIARAIRGPRPRAGVIDGTGRLGLVELAAALEQADLFVGADSGPAHLAAAVGTPAVVLFSGTNDPRQWQPCGEHVGVVRHPVECSPCHRRCCGLPDHPCMRGLTPGQVADAVEQTYRRAALASGQCMVRGVALASRPCMGRSTGKMSVSPANRNETR